MQKSGQFVDFRVKSTLGINLISFIILTPFSVNNFLQNRYLLGIASSLFVLLCLVNVWNSLRNRYYPFLISLGLVPAATIFMLFAFEQQGAVVSYWCYPIVLGMYFMLPERQAWITSAIFLAFIFPQAWLILEADLMMRFTITVLGTCAFSMMFVRVITRQQMLLQEQVITDPLTGLLNRTTLVDVFKSVIQQNRRTGTPMTILSIDIDHFKNINDDFGHSTGDDVLVKTGEFLLNRIRRSTDKVFRIGGEEFLVLLYNTDLENGKHLADNLCADFRSLPLIPDRKVTISIGVAEFHADEDLKHWLKRGDDNLYEAKAEGRDRVVAAPHVVWCGNQDNAEDKPE